MHYYKRHIGDYAKKAGHLSPLEHGVYNLIIDSYYDREHAPTINEAMRWARARTDDEKEAVKNVLEEFFTLEGNQYRQNRIEDELEQYRGKAETNRAIAVEREKRKREQSVKSSSTSRQPEQHDSCTSGQPNHKPLTTNQEPVTKDKPKAPPSGDADMFPNVDPQVVSDFKALRRQKKAAITKTAMDRITSEAEKAGLSLEAALRLCCSRGWQGFQAEWVAPRGGNGSASGDKFQVAHLDHSSSRAAMEASMKKHNVVVPEDGDIPF